jgi:hypothetical protein
MFGVRLDMAELGWSTQGVYLLLRLLEEHLEEYIPQLESTGQESPDTGKR